MEGHLEGMLDRDQRTAKLRLCTCNCLVTYGKNKQQSETNHNTQIGHCSFPRRTSPSHCSYLTWKGGYFWTSLQKLKQVLLVGIYLALITFPSTLSAPTNIKMSARMKEQPKWHNPCGISQTSSDFDHNNPGIQGITDTELLSQIVNQSDFALHKAEEIKDMFAYETFKMESAELHQFLEKQHYDWLPKLPKKLGEEVPQEHLEKLNFDDALLDAYEYLQTIAVGLEQVVWDQVDKQGKFVKEFGDAEHNLRSVLCELQMTMIERNLAMRPDVPRTVMSDEFRYMDTTSSKTRDWIIYRDYMNALDYVVKSFTYMKDHMTK